MFCQIYRCLTHWPLTSVSRVEIHMKVTIVKMTIVKMSIVKMTIVKMANIAAVIEQCFLS